MGGNNKDWIHRIADFISDKGAEMLNVLATALYVIVGFLFSTNNNNLCFEVIAWILFIFTFILCIYANYRIFKKNNTLNDIKMQEIEQATRIQLLESTIEKYGEENYNLFKYVLISISKSLDFNSNERVSVYKRKKDKFVIMSRYSINPDYDRLNRQHYPISDGFIGLALRNGDFYIGDLPEFKNKKKEEYYSKILSLCVIDKDVLKNIKMKSRTFYCKALTDATDTERKAVIVFESTKENKFTKEMINNALASEEAKLAAFVDKLRFKLPDMNTDIANELGF